ncbi:MAG: prepilin-type N-terminal cleavage/methylation domain-containing protein [Thermodesulfobacteriota bacterium]
MTRPSAGGTGFTLIELLIVIMIIGILASLATYGYRHMVNKARMTQAQVALKHLHKTEETYFSEMERYTANLSILGFDPLKYDYYDLSVTLDNTGLDFLGLATGIRQMTGDWWTITKAGVPIQSDNSVFR